MARSKDGTGLLWRAGVAVIAMLGLVVVTALLHERDGAGPAAGSPAHHVAEDPPAPKFSDPRTLWPTGLPSEPLPTSLPDGSCGPWSADGSHETRTIADTHGALQSCLRIGDVWVVTTQHAVGPGEVGTLACAATDDACMNGWDTHDLTTFDWVRAPSGTTLKLQTADRGILKNADGAGFVSFDLATRDFVR